MKKLALCSFILLLSQCNKYDNTIAASELQVPPYTETGANTFGCLVNGEPWANFGETWVQPSESFGSNRPNLVRSSFQFNGVTSDTILYVTASLTIQKKGMATREEFMSMTVSVNGKLKGVHQLTGSGSVFNYGDLLHNKSYGSLARNPFTVTIKKDSITTPYRYHIVSGTFNGILYNYDQTDSLRIVGGVFDTLVQ